MYLYFHTIKDANLFISVHNETKPNAPGAKLVAWPYTLNCNSTYTVFVPQSV